MGDAANTVPVTILTGFLGSGKTTVLNHLLRQPSLADTVVIVNEFGAVGLDHLLIEQAIEDAVLLKNGCICCTVRGDIADTLDVLWQRREAGEMPPFRRIAIETTGLADPAPVAHALLAEPGARYACRLDGIVTTVDALHGRDAARAAARGAPAGGDGRSHPAHQDRPRQPRADRRGRGAHRGAERRRHRCGMSSPVPSMQRTCSIWAATARGWNNGCGRSMDGITAISTCRSVTANRSARSCCAMIGRSPGASLRHWLESVLSLRGDSVLRLKGIVWLQGETRPSCCRACITCCIRRCISIGRSAGRGHADRADHAWPVCGGAACEFRNCLKTDID